MLNIERLIAEDDAYALALEVVVNNPIAGVRPIHRSGGGPLHFEFRRASGVDCSLSVSFGEARRVEARRARRGAPAEAAMVLRPRIEICWSSTGRSVAAATAAVALYREVTELAALIEAQLERETVGFPLREDDARGAEDAR